MRRRLSHSNHSRELNPTEMDSMRTDKSIIGRTVQMATLLLSDETEEIWQGVQANDFHDCVQPFARAIEAKLKEKNT